jgi:hypothetical protein
VRHGGVLDPRWKYRGRRHGVVHFDSDDIERRTYDRAELTVWALLHPASFDDVTITVDCFAPDEVLRRVALLRHLAHVAIDQAADAALERHHAWRALCRT